MSQTRTKSELILLEPIIEKYSVTRTLNADEQKELYKEVKEIVERDYKNAPIFQAYREFNEQTGEINGSNLFRLILANKVLAEKSERTLTFKEGMQLDKQGKLSNGVYRDFGLVVYDSQEPNKEIAESLIKQVEKRGWELPILAHPSSLNIQLAEDINIFFSDNDSLIISGEEAREHINKFNYRADSGVRRLYRGGDRFWYADWDSLASSHENGRMDWIRGEVTAQNLEISLDSYIFELEKEKSKQIQHVEERYQRALNILKGN